MRTKLFTPLRFYPRRIFALIALGALAAAGCSPPPPTPDQDATAQALVETRLAETAAAATATPTITPSPTSSATSTLTPTATPTFTPAPTATPLGTGGLIAFTSGESIYLLDVTSRTVYEVGKGTWPSWTADGRSLVYMESLETAPRVIGLDLMTGESTELANVSSLVSQYSTIRDLALAPDGGIYFSMDCTQWSTIDPMTGAITSTGGRVCPSLYYRPPDVAELRSRYLGDLLPIQARISPDGQKIAFIAARVGWQYELYVANIDGSDIQQVTDFTRHESTPAWSPDSRFLAFTSSSDNRDDVYLYELETGSLAKLSTVGGNSPVWSPDGSRIAFNSSDQIHVHTLETGETQALEVGGESLRWRGSPSWSPDSGSIAFTRSGRIFVVPADGGAPLQIPTRNQNLSMVIWSGQAAGGFFIPEDAMVADTSSASPLPTDTPTPEGLPPNLAWLTQLVEDGVLSSTNGTHTSLPDTTHSWAQLGWYQWYPTGHAPSNFVLDAYVSWEIDSDRADWATSGCGFVFRESNDDNFYVALFTMGGYVEFARYVNGVFADLGNKSYGFPTADRQTGSRSLTLVVEGSRISMYVNGLLYHQRNDTALTEGTLNFAVLSGTNQGYGVRCKWTNINLFEPIPTE